MQGGQGGPGRGTRRGERARRTRPRARRALQVGVAHEPQGADVHRRARRGEPGHRGGDRRARDAVADEAPQAQFVVLGGGGDAHHPGAGAHDQAPQGVVAQHPRAVGVLHEPAGRGPAHVLHERGVGGEPTGVQHQTAVEFAPHGAQAADAGAARGPVRLGAAGGPHQAGPAGGPAGGRVLQAHRQRHVRLDAQPGGAHRPADQLGQPVLVEHGLDGGRGASVHGARLRRRARPAPGSPRSRSGRSGSGRAGARGSRPGRPGRPRSTRPGPPARRRRRRG